MFDYDKHTEIYTVLYGNLHACLFRFAPSSVTYSLLLTVVAITIKQSQTIHQYLIVIDFKQTTINNAKTK